MEIRPPFTTSPRIPLSSTSKVKNVFSAFSRNSKVGATSGNEGGEEGPPCLTLPPRKSKVGEYIREMKRNDAVFKIQKQILKREDLNNRSCLEDLYLGEESPEAKMSPETAKRELRKTLRIVKEKDMVILKLREACHDLSVKYADAENTIDAMRFVGVGTNLRKSKSELLIGSSEEKVRTKDQATETRVDVLSESVSTWMEKIKNWKTESMFNTSADADSGFRESDLIEHEALPLRRHHSKCMLTTQEGTQTPTHSLQINSAQLTNPRVSFSRSTRSQSYTNLHWPLRQPPSANHTSPPRADVDYFQRLDPLLDEATATARRIQKKSRKLAQIMQSVDKKV